MSAGGIHLSEAAQKGKFPEGSPRRAFGLGSVLQENAANLGRVMGHGGNRVVNGEGCWWGAPPALANHAERSNTTIPTARPTQSLCKHDFFHKQLQITWERRSLVPAPCTLFSTGRIASKSRAIGHVLLATTLMMLWVSSCNASGEKKLLWTLCSEAKVMFTSTCKIPKLQQRFV